MNNNKIYKVGDTYYRLDLIQSISELYICDNDVIGFIKGNKFNWYIGYSHYKPEYQQDVINENPTYQEYNTLLKAFKEQQC